LRPLKILMVSARYPPAVGGVEKHVSRLAHELVKRGHHVRIITSSHEPNLSPTGMSDAGVEVFRMPYGWNRAPFLGLLWMLRHSDLWRDRDVIHAHDVYPPLFWCAPLMIEVRKRLFVTFHGYERDPIPSPFIFLRRVARKLARGGNICVGRFIETCYGIACDRVVLGATDLPQRTERQEMAVYVGRIESDTGIEQYIHAIHTLREKHGISLALKVVGNGSQRRRMAALAHELELDVEFLGEIEDPWSVIGSAKICLAVGFLSILEAMARGIPVVGYATSPLRLAYLKSVREEGGPISIQTTSEGVARELARILTDTRLEESVSVRSREFAKRWTWDSMTQAYLRLWSKGLG